MEKRRRKQNRRRMRAVLYLVIFGALLLAVRNGWNHKFTAGNLAKTTAGSSRIDLSDEIEKGKIPLFYQTDERWADYAYGTDTMDITGCGPTCLSMVVCGLSGEGRWSPPEVARYAEENGYYVEGSGSKWSLMTEGAEGLGLSAKELPLEEGVIRDKLESGSPVICIMGEGDFTTTGHYIVLAGENEDGSIQVNDPNSKKNSGEEWDLQLLMPQMKNLWAYNYRK